MVYENDKCAYPCEDECLDGSNECDAYATCENIPGTYDCDCVEGFLGNGRSCENVDECRMRVHKCSANAICHDATEGAYDCECIDGYDGNGMECNDIDECSRNSHSCGENTDCINILGSYKCQCSQGFVEDFAGNTGPVDIPFLDRVLTLTNVISEVIIVKAIKNAKISKALINASVALALSRITTMYYLMMHQRVWTIMNVVMVNMTVVRTEPVLTRLGHIRVNVILDFLAMVLNALTQMNVQKIVTLATHLPTALIQRL